VLPMLPRSAVAMRYARGVGVGAGACAVEERCGEDARCAHDARSGSKIKAVAGRQVGAAAAFCRCARWRGAEKCACGVV